MSKPLEVIMGLNFLKKIMQGFYQAHGIVLQQSCSGTPQQNGSVERKYRNLHELEEHYTFKLDCPDSFEEHVYL